MKYPQRLFIDTAVVEEIERLKTFVDGVTTNPAIIAKSGLKVSEIDEQIKKICDLGDWPVSVELPNTRLETGELIEEAYRLHALDKDKIVIKLPLLGDLDKYLNIVDCLYDAKIPVNVTCLMTLEQMILAANSVKKFPVSYISLFWARSIEDHERYRSNQSWVAEHPKMGTEVAVNAHPSTITRAISDFLIKSESNARIIIGSIRDAGQVGDAFASGADIVTVTTDIIEAMSFSQRTAETIVDFDNAFDSIKK
jgi:transaldolase